MIITPVSAVDWGAPLSTDPPSDGSNFGEDILAVDAHYATPFVYFRFQLNEPIIDIISYEVLVDYDKNTSSGIKFLNSDIGMDFHFQYRTHNTGSGINLTISFDIYGGSNFWVTYNVTAGGSAIGWSAPAIVSYFELVTFNNASQAELAFGVNWIWVVSQIAGAAGDGCSMYLEFRASSIATDWCPDRTGNSTDYFTWNICTDEGIPGFSFGLTLFCFLTLLAGILLLERKQLKF